MDLARDVVLTELEGDPLLLELGISLLEMFIEESQGRASLRPLTQGRILAKASTPIPPPPVVPVSIPVNDRVLHGDH